MHHQHQQTSVSRSLQTFTIPLFMAKMPGMSNTFQLKNHFNTVLPTLSLFSNFPGVTRLGQLCKYNDAKTG